MNYIDLGTQKKNDKTDGRRREKVCGYPLEKVISVIPDFVITSHWSDQLTHLGVVNVHREPSTGNPENRRVVKKLQKNKQTNKQTRKHYFS